MQDILSELESQKGCNDLMRDKVSQLEISLNNSQVFPSSTVKLLSLAFSFSFW
jgi:hypothetical protein